MNASRAKKYSHLKLIVSLTHLAFSAVFWTSLILTPLGQWLARLSRDFTPHPLLQFYIFSFFLALIYSSFSWPLSFYSEYMLEHRFHLSNQRLTAWLFEQLKGLMVGFILGAIILTVFYLFLFHSPRFWWFWLWLFLFFFSVLLTRLAPVLLFPLFYKFSPIDQPALKERLQALGAKWGLNITGVFKFNLSKTTRKANAAFTGLGKSKRVILGDTLLENFTPDEIETVFAHEIGHFRHRHLLKGILLNSFSLLLSLWLVSQIYRQILAQFHWTSWQLEALPYLGFLLFFFGLFLSIIGNYISRTFEYQADAFAARAAGGPDIFVAALRKIADLNLADPSPHPLIEYLFYSHPSIVHRIQKLQET